MNETCVDQKLVRTDQYINFDAKVKVRTNVRLLEIEIEADCVCSYREKIVKEEIIVPKKAVYLVGSQPKPKPKLAPKPKPMKPLHLVFLVDTSDSFNKLDMSSTAGATILQNFVGNFLKNGKYAERGVPTSVTIIQFSGIGSDARYQPGTQGLVKNTPLRHYKIELGPIDISKLSEKNLKEKFDVLKNVESIDGNGQLYLALQDLSLENFHKTLENVCPGESEKALIVVTDEEWDFKDLKLHSEISEEQNLTPDQRKTMIIEFAKKQFSQIHMCVIVEKTTGNNDRFEKIKSQFVDNVHMLQKSDIESLRKQTLTENYNSMLGNIKSALEKSFKLKF